jgi:hypothetical protein
MDYGGISYSEVILDTLRCAWTPGKAEETVTGLVISCHQRCATKRDGKLVEEVGR